MPVFWNDHLTYFGLKQTDLSNLMTFLSVTWSPQNQPKINSKAWAWKPTNQNRRPEPGDLQNQNRRHVPGNLQITHHFLHHYSCQDVSAQKLSKQIVHPPMAEEVEPPPWLPLLKHLPSSFLGSPPNASRICPATAKKQQKMAPKDDACSWQSDYLISIGGSMNSSKPKQIKISDQLIKSLLILHK